MLAAVFLVLPHFREKKGLHRSYQAVQGATRKEAFAWKKRRKAKFGFQEVSNKEPEA